VENRWFGTRFTTYEPLASTRILTVVGHDQTNVMQSIGGGVGTDFRMLHGESSILGGETQIWLGTHSRALSDPNRPTGC
jgi:hypothetical protein